MTLIGSKEMNSGGRSQQELEALMEIGKALTSLLDIEEIYRVVMDKISRLLKPDSWSLLMVDETTKELSFVIAVSPAAAELKKVRLAPGEGIAGWVARHGEPLLVPDVSRDDRFSAQVDRRSGFTTRSIICVPLKTREHTLGVIQLINGMDQGEFARTDLNILSTIADFAAIAIDNARLMEKVNQLTITDELTGLYNDRHFHTLLEYEIERARRSDTELSLVFIDLDHFKQVNDTFGHLTGSRLLKEVGQVIRKKTRKINHPARYGGDERGIPVISIFFLAYSAGAIGIRLIGGRLTDRIGESRMLPYALIVSAAGILTLTLVTGGFTLALAGLLAGGGHGLLFPVLNTLAVRGEPFEVRGKATGIFTGAIDAGNFLGSFILGMVGDLAGLSPLFAVAGGALLLGLIVGRFRQAA
jgi:GAF domain-containing protein